MEHEILFKFPQLAWLILLVIPLFFAQFALSRYRKKMQFMYTAPFLLPRLLIARSILLRHTKNIGWGIIWILACLALMGPFGNIRYSSFSSNFQSQVIPHEVIFLVDTSASMRVTDGYNDQSRLDTAKSIMEEVLKQLHGQTVSLYAFSSELSAVVPPTLDYIFTRLMMNDLHINQGDVGGTDFTSILTSLKEQVFSKPSLQHYTIFMLTDGGDTQLEFLKGASRNQAKEAILNALPNPEQFHIQIFTIGIGALQAQPIPNVSFQGKPVNSKLEPHILQSLAEQGRGSYYMAEKWTSWNLARELVSQMNKSHFSHLKIAQAERKIATVKKEDMIVDLYYQIPLGLMLLFYFLNLLLPDVRRL